jgi:chromosome segregation ATPase
MASTWFIHWVTDAGWWLSSIVASAITTGAELSTEIRDLRTEIQSNKRLFDISDAELVRVSALANELQTKVDDLEQEINSLKYNA